MVVRRLELVRIRIERIGCVAQGLGGDGRVVLHHLDRMCCGVPAASGP